MDIAKDLGQRIVEATRLAVALHMQHSLCSQSISGGTGRMIDRAGFSIDGADQYSEDVTDVGIFVASQAAASKSEAA